MPTVKDIMALAEKQKQALKKAEQKKSVQNIENLVQARNTTIQSMVPRVSKPAVPTAPDLAKQNAQAALEKTRQLLTTSGPAVTPSRVTSIDQVNIPKVVDPSIIPKMVKFATTQRTHEDPFFLGTQQGIAGVLGTSGPTAPSMISGRTPEQITASAPKTAIAGQIVGGLAASLPSYAVANKVIAEKIPALASLASKGALGKFAANLAADQLADTVVSAPGSIFESITNDKTLSEDAKRYGKIQLYNFMFNVAIGGGMSALGAVKDVARKSKRPAVEVMQDMINADPVAKVSIQEELGLPKDSTWAEIEARLQREADAEQYYQQLERQAQEAVERQQAPQKPTEPFTGVSEYGVPEGMSYEEFAFKQEQDRLAEEYLKSLEYATNVGQTARTQFPERPFSGTSQYGVPEGMTYAEYQRMLDEEQAVENYYRQFEKEQESGFIPESPKQTPLVPQLQPRTPDITTARTLDTGSESSVIPYAPTLLPPKKPFPQQILPTLPNIERELFPPTMRQPSPGPSLPQPAIIEAQQRATRITPEIGAQPIKPQAQAVAPEIPRVTAEAKIIPSEKVANVLTEPIKPKLIPANEKAESVYQMFVSTSRPLERIGGKVKDLASTIRKSAGSVDYVLGKEMVDNEGNVLGKSLVDVFRDIPSAQKKDLFEYAYHKHNIARMAQGKPVFGESVTPEMSAQFVADMEANNPGIAQKAQEITKYLDDLMQGWAVKSGLVTEDTMKQLREMYPDYVPTYRDRSELAKPMNAPKGQGLNVLKKAEGSSRDLIPLDQQIAEMTNRVVRASRKNEMYNSMQDMFEQNPDMMNRWFKPISKEAQDITEGLDGIAIAMDEPIKKVGDSYVLNFFRNGEKVQAEISQDMYNALKSVGELADEQKVLAMIRKYGTNPFKSLITQYNPLFAVSNIMRDIPSAIVYSHNAKEWAKNVPDAIKEIVSDGHYWKEYQALGGTRSGIFTSEKGVTPLFKGEQNIVSKTGKKTLEGIEWFNNLTETVPRFSEYLATVKPAGNTYDSRLRGMMNASEITTDFSRSGRATKAADAFVPYLNPSVQGIDKFFRQLINKPAETIAKGTAIMTAPALILDQINKDNPEYKEISAREKNGFYLVPDGKGKFYRIPKSRELGVAFSTLFEWVARRSRGEEVTAKEVIDTVKENFTPVSIVDSTLFTPLYKGIRQIKEPEAEVRSFAGIPIEPASMKRFKPSERYDQYTSEVAKAIGTQFEISPKAIDYILRSYGGIIGQTLLPQTSQKTRPGISGVIEAKFKSDPVFKSENTNKLYNALTKAQQEANSLDRQLGVTTETDRKTTTNKEKLVSDLNKVSKKIAEYRKQQKVIDAETTTSEADQAKRIRELQKKMNELAKQSLQSKGLWR